MRKPLKIGVVGCGWFAQAVHIPLLSRLPGVELAALSEPDPHRRQEAGRRAEQGQVYADYRDMLRMRNLDAVVVTVPTALHAEVAIAAMQSGKHVYLEKPIATSMSEADKIVDVWQKAGVVGMVGFNYRCNPLHVAARKQIEARRIGPLITVQSMFSTPPRMMPDWKRARMSGGGVLLDLASHHVDLVRFLFQQDIQIVSAKIESHRTEHDTATLHLQLVDGLSVQSSFSLCSKDEDRFEIQGHAGSMTVDRYRSLAVKIVDAASSSSSLRRMTEKLRGLAHLPYLVQKLRSPWHEPSYREALLRFVSAVRQGTGTSPDLLDGYRSLEVIAAAEQSARTGQSVSLASSTVDR